MVAAQRAGHDLVTALANFTTSFFYPTLEQGGSREYDAAYLAVEQIDPAMTGRQWRYQQCSEVGWFQNAPAKDAVRSPKLDAAYQRAACARIFGRGGFTLLPDPERLTRALPDIYRTLTQET